MVDKQPSVESGEFQIEIIPQTVARPGVAVPACPYFFPEVFRQLMPPLSLPSLANFTDLALLPRAPVGSV